MIVRIVTPEDTEAVASIYAPIVRETAISFEMDPPKALEFARRIVATLPQRPWLVAEEAGRVLGYAYAGPHRLRAAYGWSVESSVYVAAGARRRGVGRTLYAALLAVLRLQGFANVYGGITLPNEPSLAFHRAFGFEEVGVYRRVGYKHGRWHDVWWGGLDLAPDREGPPPPPQTVLDLEASGALAAALEAPSGSSSG